MWQIYLGHVRLVPHHFPCKHDGSSYAEVHISGKKRGRLFTRCLSFLKMSKCYLAKLAVEKLAIVSYYSWNMVRYFYLKLGWSIAAASRDWFWSIWLMWYQIFVQKYARRTKWPQLMSTPTNIKYTQEKLVNMQKCSFIASHNVAVVSWHANS